MGNMDTGSLIALIALALTVAGAIITFTFKLGHTINRLEQVEDDMSKIGEKIDLLERVDATVSDIKTRVSRVPDLAAKMDILWEARLVTSRSPRQLNELGNKVLGESGIKDIVDGRFELILSAVREMNPQNAYRAEECVLEAVNQLAVDQILVPKLEDGAFRSGLDVNSILLVGGIYVRDRILDKLGFKVEDIDKKLT
jgi:Fe-S-cluster formation regulator IscX/YfhJ